MKNKHNHGNVLTEYGIILGLIGVLSIGALGLLGSSINGNLSGISQGNAANAMQRMSQLDFSGNAGGAVAQLGSAAPGQQSELQQPQSGKIVYTADGYPTVALEDSVSGGVNATSAEGKALAVMNRVLSTADKLAQMALATTDPAMRQWYQETANAAFSMGSSQAAYEVAKNPGFRSEVNSLISNSSNLSEESTFTSIEAWEHKLYLQRKQLFDMLKQGTVNKQVIDQARSMVDVAISETNTYYKTRFYEQGNPKFQSPDSVIAIQPDYIVPSPQDIAAATPKLLQSGALKDQSTIHTTLNTGLALNKAAEP